MATRKDVFNWYSSESEQSTYRDLYGEFVQIWGIDIVYIPRESDSPSGFDLLFGDDPTKKYVNNYTIEMYIQSVDGFEGAEFFGKFGDVVKKQAKFLMPQRAFQREVGSDLPRAREGDLLWVPNFRALFEIKKVDEEQQFYPLGINGTGAGFVGFSMVAEKFRYNNEKIITSIPAISETVNRVATVYDYQLHMGGSGTYQLSELVYQGSANNQTAFGTVVSWNIPTGMLALKDINGLFIPNTIITGANSNAQWSLAGSNILQDTNNGLMDNYGINVEGNTILNFTESNPFGQPD